MKKNTSTTHTKPAHHTRMLEQCLAKGFIKRVGDSYEITPAGHEWTRALTAARTSALTTTSTFKSDDHREPLYKTRTTMGRW